MPNITLATIIDRITEEYGRMTPKVKARLTSEINAWVDQACRKWNFWFLECEPGLSTIKIFPLDPTLSINTQVTFVQGPWIDRGWLCSTAGTVAYPFWYPTQPYWDSTSDPPVTSTYMRGWMPVEISRLLYVKGFNARGTPRKDLEIFPYQDFMTRARFDAQGEPDYCTFVTENGLSSLLFNSIPDQSYLYQIGFKLASLPPLERPDSTNLFAQYYPNVLVCVGIIKAARYFGEKTEVQSYLVDLFGESYAKERNPDQTPGGMIGDILSEGRQRHTGRSKTLKVYTSSRSALYRQGSQRKFIPGGYYWDGMP